MTTDPTIEAVARAIYEAHRPNHYANWEWLVEHQKDSADWWRNEIAQAAITAYEQSRWRDIKSAPKDGTKILLAEPNPGGTEIPWLVIEARWISCPHSNSRSGETNEFWAAAYPAIYSDMDGNQTWRCRPIVAILATHWQPPPSPPENPDG